MIPDDSGSLDSRIPVSPGMRILSLHICQSLWTQEGLGKGKVVKKAKRLLIYASVSNPFQALRKQMFFRFMLVHTSSGKGWIGLGNLGLELSSTQKAKYVII